MSIDPDHDWAGSHLLCSSEPSATHVTDDNRRDGIEVASNQRPKRCKKAKTATGEVLAKAKEASQAALAAAKEATGGTPQKNGDQKPSAPEPAAPETSPEAQP